MSKEDPGYDAFDNYTFIPADLRFTGPPDSIPYLITLDLKRIRPNLFLDKLNPSDPFAIFRPDELSKADYPFGEFLATPYFFEAFEKAHGRPPSLAEQMALCAHLDRSAHSPNEGSGLIAQRAFLTTNIMGEIAQTALKNNRVDWLTFQSSETRRFAEYQPAHLMYPSRYRGLAYVLFQDPFDEANTPFDTWVGPRPIERDPHNADRSGVVLFDDSLIIKDHTFNAPSRKIFYWWSNSMEQHIRDEADQFGFLPNIQLSTKVLRP